MLYAATKEFLDFINIYNEVCVCRRISVVWDFVWDLSADAINRSQKIRFRTTFIDVKEVIVARVDHKDEGKI